jgi:hypothetical protein
MHEGRKLVLHGLVSRRLDTSKNLASAALS